MNWLRDIVSLISGKNSTQHTNSGIIEYHEDGFTIRTDEFFKRIQWDEITQLNAYKVDLMTIDSVEMEIVYGDKSFIINEDLPGWEEFIVKTKEVFPEIPKDWDIKIVQPPFATNYTPIYKKT